MSITNLDPIERAALTHPCPKCWVAAGVWCHTTHGRKYPVRRPTRTLHQPRMKLGWRGLQGVAQ